MILALCSRAAAALSLAYKVEFYEITALTFYQQKYHDPSGYNEISQTNGWEIALVFYQIFLAMQVSTVACYMCYMASFRSSLEPR